MNTSKKRFFDSSKTESFGSARNSAEFRHAQKLKISDKRGQELSTTTIILIVLGVLILVILIIGFTIGWKKIFPWISPPNNVKEVSDACNLACSTQNKYDFCTLPREVRVEKEVVSTVGVPSEKFSANCEELSSKYTKLGIVGCPGLCPEIKKKCVDELGGTLQPTACIATTQDDLTSQASDVTDTNKFCCKVKAVP